MATYGWQRNKSKSDVYSKEEADEQFAAKTDLDRYARKSHASTSTDYGVGSETSYGHLRISDNSNAPGVAFSGKAGQQLKARVENDENTITQLAMTVNTLNNRVYVAVGNIAISSETREANFFANVMKYGTWQYVGDVKGQIYQNAQWVDITIGYAFKRLS